MSPDHPAGAEPAVLVLRALGLGDALTGVAALRGVRRRWPDHRVVLAGPPGPGALLVARGVVDEVLPWTGLQPLDPRLLAAHGLQPARTGPGGHVAMNLHGRGPQSHRLLTATAPRRLLGFRCDEAEHPHGPQWRDSEHEVRRWCRLVTGDGGSCGPEDLRLQPDAARGALPAPVADVAPGAVVVHPGAASGSRRWPVDRWAALVAELVADGSVVAVTGGPGERDLTAAVAAAAPRAPGSGQALDLGGALDLEQLLAVVAQARLLVCGDTGVAHLATACGTPSVLLFGPTPPGRWGPVLDPDRHRVLWHGADDEAGDPHADAVDPRLDAVSVAEVLAATGSLLATAGR